MEPTCICLLSHYPFFSVLRALLREVYWCVHSRTAHVPIERLVERIVNDLPLPAARSCACACACGALAQRRRWLRPHARGRSAQAWLSARAARAAPTARRLSPLSLTASTTRDRLPTHFALCDFPLRTLFDCLGVFNVVRLVAALLGESKMVVISQQSSLLTVACETLTALMYPFQWPYVCLPILPRSLTDLMQAPTPYLLGMHPSFLEHVNSEIDLTDVIVVNLDVGDVRGPVPDKLPRVLVDIVTQKLSRRSIPRSPILISRSPTPTRRSKAAAAAAGRRRCADAAARRRRKR
jgi:hypothetical protein